MGFFGAREKVKMNIFPDFVLFVLTFVIPVRPESSGRALWLRDLGSTTNDSKPARTTDVVQSGGDVTKGSQRT
jgi:hypothetical protein